MGRNERFSVPTVAEEVHFAHLPERCSSAKAEVIPNTSLV